MLIHTARQILEPATQAGVSINVCNDNCVACGRLVLAGGGFVLAVHKHPTFCNDATCLRQYVAQRERTAVQMLLLYLPIADEALVHARETVTKLRRIGWTFGEIADDPDDALLTADKLNPVYKAPPLPMHTRAANGPAYAS